MVPLPPRCALKRAGVKLMTGGESVFALRLWVVTQGRCATAYIPHIYMFLHIYTTLKCELDVKAQPLQLGAKPQ